MFWYTELITRHYSANSTFTLCVQLQLQNTMWLCGRATAWSHHKNKSLKYIIHP